jgi:hypothetical protein
MSEIYESCADDGTEMMNQIDRIVAYEREKLNRRPKPILAAMFLVYLLSSVTLIGLLAYWLFY